MAARLEGVSGGGRSPTVSGYGDGSASVVVVSEVPDIISTSLDSGSEGSLSRAFVIFSTSLGGVTSTGASSSLKYCRISDMASSKGCSVCLKLSRIKVLPPLIPN